MLIVEDNYGYLSRMIGQVSAFSSSGRNNTNLITEEGKFGVEKRGFKNCIFISSM
jgi:hypothetical protein